ncbi:hypothetical protein QL285_008397 [Trifolium repens]|nr:hypothetical protein QL285_008397 [Trifolium repens]
MLLQVLVLPVEVPRQIRLLRILLAVGRQGMLCSVPLYNVHHVGGGGIWVTPSPSGRAYHIEWPSCLAHTLRTGAAGLAAGVPAAAAVVAVAAAPAGLS